MHNMSRKSLSVACLMLIAFAAVAQAQVTVSVTGYLGDYTPFAYSGALDVAVNGRTGQAVRNRRKCATCYVVNLGEQQGRNIRSSLRRASLRPRHSA